MVIVKIKIKSDSMESGVGAWIHMLCFAEHGINEHSTVALTQMEIGMCCNVGWIK